MTTTSAPAEMTAAAQMPARLVAAWAAHDADAFADLFTEDGTLILPGLYKKGKDEIRAYMAAEFAGRYQGTRVTGQPIDVKRLGADAVVLVTEGGVLAAGESELSSAAAIRAVWVLVPRDGAWSLAVYQNCPRDAVN